MSDQQKRQIFLDTETTGFEPGDGDRIVEIGGVEVIDRKITGVTQHFYVDPEREVPQEAVNVHGLTRAIAVEKAEKNFIEGTQKGIYFRDIAEEFIEFVRDAEVIIHNAPFDVNFIDHELSMLPKSSPYSGKKIGDYCTITDSLVIARNKHPGKPNKLDSLASRYQIDNSARKDSGLHGALIDSDLLAHVYLAMTTYQNNLIHETKKTAVQQSLTVNRLSIPGIDALPTVAPTAEEITEHDKMMEIVEKKSGGPVWSSFDM